MNSQNKPAADDRTPPSRAADPTTVHGVGFLPSLERLDRALFRFIFFGMQNRLLTAFVPAVSQLGDRVILWLALSGFMLLYGGDREWTAVYHLIAALAFAGLFAECTIKLVWKRPRPFLVFGDVSPRVDRRRVERRPSFPSGHSASFFAAAAALSHFYPQFSGGLHVLAAVGAFSRVYTGVHFPSDALAGVALGLLSGWLGTIVPPDSVAAMF